MENKEIVIQPRQKSDTIAEYLIFDWKLEKEETLENGNLKLFLSRDDSTSYHTKLVEIEENFKPKIIPLFITILPVVLSFILITIYLILYLTNKDNFSNPLMAILFYVPSSIFLFVTVILTFFRMKEMQNYVANKHDNLAKIKIEIENLKQDCQK